MLRLPEIVRRRDFIGPVENLFLPYTLQRVPSFSVSKGMGSIIFLGRFFEAYRTVYASILLPAVDANPKVSYRAFGNFFYFTYSNQKKLAIRPANQPSKWCISPLGGLPVSEISLSPKKNAEIPTLPKTFLNAH